MPAYFEKDIDSGIPTLTEAGRKVLEEELAEPSTHEVEGEGETQAEEKS